MSCDLLEAIKREMLRALVVSGVDRSDAQVRTAEACDRLLFEFGGERHWLPRLDRPARNAVIVARHANGDHPTVIARTMTISRRTVERVVQRNQDDEFGRPEWML